MQTRVWRVDPHKPEYSAIEEAAAVLKRGGTVAFPTETVYGLGADALQAEAVRKIFAAKGRPADNPLIVHVASQESCKRLAGDIPETARELMNRFWPGPLTVILPRNESVPGVTTGGLDTVAVRMPDHPVALALIEASRPLAAPSANLSRRPSPTTAEHVIEDLWGRIDGIIDGGPTGVGVESTVVDVTGPVPVLLRPGGITVEMLRQVCSDLEVDPGATGQDSFQGKQVRSPGMKYKHYAPKAEAVLVEGDPLAVASKVQELADTWRSQGLRVGIMGTSEHAAAFQADVVLDMGSRHKPEEVATKIYSCLRTFDAEDVDRIVIEGIESAGVGLAVMNRLRKAASHNIIRVSV